MSGREGVGGVNEDFLLSRVHPSAALASASLLLGGGGLLNAGAKGPTTGSQ